MEFNKKNVDYFREVRTIGEEYTIVKRFRNEIPYEETTEPIRRPPKTSAVSSRNQRADPGHITHWGRTLFDWIRSLIFYILLYLAIACLFFGEYKLFEQFLSSGKPNRLQKQPGLSYAPNMNAMHIISYNPSDKNSVNAITKKMLEFMSKYGNRTNIGPCTKETHYGYANYQPCIFLKINRIIGFTANTYENASHLPATAPNELKMHIEQLAEAERKNRIWLACTSGPDNVQITYATKSRAVETKYVNMKEKIEYTMNGEKNFYNDTDYERIVAVQFLQMPQNKIIQIICTMWAKNIKIMPTTAGGFGMIQFRFDIK